MGKPRPQPTDLLIRLGWRQPRYAGAPQGRANCLAAALKRLGRSYGFIVVEIQDAEPQSAQEEVAKCPACAEEMELVADYKGRHWCCTACGRWLHAEEEAPQP